VVAQAVFVVVAGLTAVEDVVARQCAAAPQCVVVPCAADHPVCVEEAARQCGVAHQCAGKL